MRKEFFSFIAVFVYTKASEVIEINAAVNLQ
jgi:hypothetical protein